MPLPAPSRRRAALCRPVAAALAAILLCGHAAAGPVRTVALSGQLVPGTTTGETFQSFGNAQINSLGAVSFTASGIWTDASGILQRIVNFSEPAPGLPADVRAGFGLTMSALNRSGQVAYFSALSGPGINSDNNESAWSTASGNLVMVARDGDPAPGLPAGSSFYFIWIATAFNDAGQTLFSAGIREPGATSPNGGGLWMESGGIRTAVVYPGMQLPGMPVGSGLRGGILSAPWNRAGQVVFRGEITPPIAPDVYEKGIWQGSPGNMRLVMKSGAQAPGTAPGVVFATNGFGPMQNHFGQVAFTSALSGTDVNPANDFGLWREHAGGIELAWREGETPLGVTEGLKFSTSNLDIVGYNEVGDLAVSTYLEGAGVTSANDQALWVRRDDGFHLIVREGDHAVGTVGEVNYAQILTPAALNATGQVAFQALLSGPGVSYLTNNERALYATDIAGDLHLIARTGDPIEVAPGDWRTATHLGFPDFTSTNRGRATVFNDRGQLAFAATFSDGTKGMFVSDAAAITPGDFNRDGSVTAADLPIWRTAMASPTATPNLFADGDFDVDVDGDDLLVWQRNLGAQPQIAAPVQRIVPEPATATLFAAALLLLPRRRAI